MRKGFIRLTRTDLVRLRTGEMTAGSTTSLRISPSGLFATGAVEPSLLQPTVAARPRTAIEPTARAITRRVRFGKFDRVSMGGMEVVSKKGIRRLAPSLSTLPPRARGCG